MSSRVGSRVDSRFGSRVVPTARALGAFALANARYWLTVAGEVRAQMRHWEARARAIEDPGLRELALEKLREEGFNAEAAAMAATIAPRHAREHAVRAIVALELMFDLLDGLTERPHEDPLGEGERLYAVFVAALECNGPAAQGSAIRPGRVSGAGQPFADQDKGDEAGETATTDRYLHELAGAVRAALAELPAASAIEASARRCALRGSQAQTRMHATATLGRAQLAGWAREQTHETELAWREFLAGAACSVLALHALIAAAADPRTTPADALAIETAYLYTGAVVTLLDGVIDHAEDAAAETLSYAALFEDRQLLALALAQTAQQAARRSAQLRNGSHHLMTLAAAMAYWCSTAGAREPHARPLIEQLRDTLPLGVPLLAMRVWRAARAIRPNGRTVSTNAQSLLS